MVRTAEAHSLPARPDNGRHQFPGPEHNGERPGPETRSQCMSLYRHLPAAALHGARVRDHEGEGLDLGPALYLVDLLHRLLIEAVSRKAVHRLRGDGHQPAGLQKRGCFH